jgi:uncharacterized membrane protein
VHDVLSDDVNEEGEGENYVFVAVTIFISFPCPITGN